nr:reverse transcriptase domain-containing protein [Tanacetum cinerariifolium]
MGYKHLDTIPEKESDEFIKSSVENLVPNPSESEDLSNVGRECNVPEIYSNPLFDEEIISIKIDPHHFNAESDLIESLLNQDYLIISSSKINSLLDEFAGELIFLKSIPPGIDKADCDPEKQIRLIEKLLYDNSSPRPSEEFNSKNSDAIIESFSPSPIHNDDYDTEGDILILEELLSTDSLSPLENESFHFDISSSPRPPAKPLDDDEIEPDSGSLTVKVVGDICEHYVLMPRLFPTQPTLALNEEKSPHLLSHRGFKAFQLSFESPMMIYGGNIPILDHANFDLKTASDYRKLQLNELNELRDQAYENSLIYKERTKKLHDDKIKNRIFNDGDQVLLFNSRLKIFSGKLKSSWPGPFTISEIYPYGTAKLIHPDGCNFKVNCHRLKHYHGGDPPPLEIPDDYSPKIEDFLCRILSWFSRPSKPKSFENQRSVSLDTSLCGVSKAWSLSHKVGTCRDESRYIG